MALDIEKVLNLKATENLAIERDVFPLVPVGSPVRGSCDVSASSNFHLATKHN